MADASLHKKLGIKTGLRVLVIEPPDGVLATFEPLPAGASLHRQARGTFDLVLAFARDRAAVERLAPKAMGAVAPGGVLWMSYPKKSGTIATDITRDVGWEALTAAGWAGVSQVAIDATWSAVRFKNDPSLGEARAARAQARARQPRVIEAPPDLAQALDGDERARARWDASSYTHRKEFVQWIEEAKKPETRARRVAKALEMLAAGARGRSA